MTFVWSWSKFRQYWYHQHDITACNMISINMDVTWKFFIVSHLSHINTSFLDTPWFSVGLELLKIMSHVSHLLFTQIYGHIKRKKKFLVTFYPSHTHHTFGSDGKNSVTSWSQVSKKVSHKSVKVIHKLVTSQSQVSDQWNVSKKSHYTYFP